MRVTSISWDHERMFAGNQVLDPCGPGVEELEPVTDHSDDATAP
jgi:hypothetical protein